MGIIGIALLVGLFASNVLVGEYRLSKGWPTGHGVSIFTLSPEQEKECRKLASDALHLSRAKEPPRCGLLDATGVQKLRPNWSRVEQDRAVILWETLTVLRERPYGRTVPGAGTEQYRDTIRKALASGDIVVESSRVPLYGNGKEFTLIRGRQSLTEYLPERCGQAPDWVLRSTKWSFVNDKGEVELLSGLANPQDALVWHGRLYLISHSERDWDDSFRYRLVPPQPEIYVHVVDRGPGFSGNSYHQQCRYLFWHKRVDIKR